MFLIESLPLRSADAVLVPGERDLEQEMHDRSHAITDGREEMPACRLIVRGSPHSLGDGRAAAQAHYHWPLFWLLTRVVCLTRGSAFSQDVRRLAQGNKLLLAQRGDTIDLSPGAGLRRK